MLAGAPPPLEDVGGFSGHDVERCQCEMRMSMSVVQGMRKSDRFRNSTFVFFDEKNTHDLTLLTKVVV